MPNHPNRSAKPSLLKNPSGGELKSFCVRHQLSAREAAQLCMVSENHWNRCAAGDRNLGPASWWLARLRVGEISLGQLEEMAA